jgi:regulator of CtrA degradation
MRIGLFAWGVMTKEAMSGGGAISFGERLASSGSFAKLFKEGMALVEATASYLDREGREEAKALPRLAALSYASESMRLTTRLMQIASWLLLQRAVNEGEMTQAEASSDKRRTRITWTNAAEPELPDCLPRRLVGLIDESLRLQQRIARLDGALRDKKPAAALPAADHRTVEQQMSRLRDAFCL